MVYAVLCIIVSCAGSICETDDGNDKSKSSWSGGGTNMTVLLSGVLGYCAVHYNCKELLWTAAIINMIVLFFAIITIILAVLGLFGLCCNADGIGDALCSLMFFIISIVMILLSVGVSIAIVFISWPFLMGESLDETVGAN
jgi:hypothetical protein